MIKIKKITLLWILLLFASIGISYVRAQSVLGCCTNPASGTLACSSDRLAERDTECCPGISNNSQYYQPENPNGPLNYNDCITNFFDLGQSCSEDIDKCAIGCCCSGSTGTIEPEAVCNGKNGTFYKGEELCSAVCPSIIIEPPVNATLDCNDASYKPKFITFGIAAAKGQAKFSLDWQSECSAKSYDVLRCKGIGCTNFEVIAATTTNSLEDAFDLLFDTTYTYMIKAYYNVQTAVPAINKTASLGSMQCKNQLSTGLFCLNNTPYSCDSSNRFISKGAKCASNKVCVISNDKAECIASVSCNYNNANPFGLFYTPEGCEKGTYCFYDRSYTILNSCFACDPSMSCYDYRTETACERDNCRLGNCGWKSIESQLGTGVCVSKGEYNCQWCESEGSASLENSRSFNKVFDLCTKEKSNALSEDEFKCYFRSGKSEDCSDVVCSDYDAGQCSAGITLGQDNKIEGASEDDCGIKVCQNINNACAKNADGDSEADCTDRTCEADYFAPSTTILPINNSKGITNKFLIQIYDKTSSNSPTTLRTSGNYTTFLCVDCAQHHPYNASTNSRKIIISNLNAFDGDNGSKLLSFSDGSNILKYYSEDPSKNIEEASEATIVAHKNSTGPIVLSIDITDGFQDPNDADKYYTNSLTPTITINFVEPAIATLAQLKKKGVITSLALNTNASAAVSFPIAAALENGEYEFKLNAKNENNVFMDPVFSATIIIDDISPALSIEPKEGAVINKTSVAVNLTFNEKINPDALIVTLNSEDLAESFSTLDNKVFTARLNLTDGNKKLEVSARDLAQNQVDAARQFIVDAYPTTIAMTKPKFGTASNFTFNIVAETDNNAECHYSLGTNLDFDFMTKFTITGKTTHTITDFSGIASPDTSTHKLYVRCNNTRGITSKSFGINVDTTPPLFIQAYAYPDPVIEEPSTTSLTIQADEPVICKYSTTSEKFEDMEGKFEGYDSDSFSNITAQNITIGQEGSFSYFVACKNKAELISDIKEITFEVDLSIPIKLTSHTPEFFNSTNVVLSVQTNKIAQCTFSKIESAAQAGEIFGLQGYSHTKRLALGTGKYTYYVACKDKYMGQFSAALPVAFTIDLTPPTILYVNDSSRLENNTEFTWDTNKLRVRWDTIENESRISYHSYSLIESQTSGVIINWTTSYANSEWLTVSKTDSGSNLNLVNGNKYLFRVRATNVVDLTSNISQSDGITIDTSLKPADCTNGIKDAKETDVDCGNQCKSCETGKKCEANIDCDSSFCSSNKKCATPTCSDNVKNQQESDIDCGGPCSAKCPNNKICNINNDCESKFCSFGFCKPQESCSDLKLSPGESDIDCGGYCPTKCNAGKRCSLNEDCEEDLKCISSECKKCAENDLNCNGIPDDQEGIVDTDGDGMPDEWEIQNNLDPNDPNDAGSDPDKDGLTNYEEFNVQNTYSKNTNPNLADTDGDGFSDKEELDKGTNPLDKEDFPKSSLTKMLLFILGIVVLLSGFGHLAYKAIVKKRGEEHRLPRQREVSRAMPPQQQQMQTRQAPYRQREEEARAREALRRREEQRQKEREELFEAFGAEKKELPKEETKTPAGKPQVVEEKEPKKEEREPFGARARKRRKITKKSKEDVFAKLREIAKETRKRKGARRKNARK